MTCRIRVATLLLVAVNCFLSCALTVEHARGDAFTATHFPARGPDAALALGVTANTVAASDPLFDWDLEDFNADELGQWRWRPSGTLGLADEGWHEADYNYPFPNDGEPPVDRDAPMLITTITGLEPNSDYNIYVDYLVDVRTTGSGVVNWTIAAGFAPDALTAYGTVDGVPMGSFTTVGLGDPAVTDLGVDSGNNRNYRAFLGMVSSDGSGDVSVYIDDTDNMSLFMPGDESPGTAGSNGRAAYDGLAFELVGAPTLTIDRETGEIVYNSGVARDIIGYSMLSSSGTLDRSEWTSIADAYDATAVGPNAGLVDGDDSWVELGDSASFNDMSEAELNLSGPQDGGSLPANTPISFGNAWLPYFNEDVTFDLLLSDGSIESVAVIYEGNSGVGFPEGDFDFNGSVGPEDYSIFISSLFAPITGSVVEAYALGDLTQDIQVDYDDLVAFRAIYDAANGAGAFASLASGATVPEPSSLLLLGLPLGSVLLLRKRLPISLRAQLLRPLLVVCVAVVSMLLSAGAHAQIIYVDAVPNNVDGVVNPSPNTTLIDGSPWSATATGSGDGLYFFRENPNWGNDGIYETNANGAEDAPILVTTVEGLDPTASYFLYGFFWSNPSQNWRLKTTVDPGVIDDNDTPGDPLDDFIPNDPAYSFSAGGSATSTDAPEASASDFDGSVVVGTNPRLYVAELGIHTPQPNGDVVFYVDDLANQTSSTFRTWYDGVGYEKVLDLTLEINTATGTTRIKNPSGGTVDLNYYKITSDSNELNPAEWSTLDMQNIDAVDGDDPGTVAGDSGLEGWDTAGGSGVGLLSEVNFLGSTGLSDQTAFPLGQAFMPGVNSGVTFEFESQQGLRPGLVEFINEPELPGDYDNNGTVEQLDYQVWKSAFGQTGLDLDADGNGDGRVGLGDYTIWRDNLGASLPPAALSANVVPEPATWVGLSLAICGFSFARRRVSRALAGSASVSLAACLTITAVLFTSSATAVTLDREYLLGDDPLEGGAAGDVVGSANMGALAAGNTADSFGPIALTFLDLIVGGTPEYVNVDLVGGGRPQTTAPNSQGVQFDGATDYLEGIPLNRPDELALILATAESPTTYPLNYDEITGRGMQMWVYPDQAGIDAGAFQSIVSDSIYAGGPAIDEQGRWTQMNSGHFATTTTGPASTVDVVGDTWYHVMQHVYLNGSSESPRVVAGTGAEADFTSVVYVDGIAVSVNNDTMGFTREYQLEPELIITGNSAPDYDHRLVVGGSELPNPNSDGPTLFGNFFDGVVDDLEMYVYGDNSGLPGGQDWGTFDLFEDNAWISNQIDTDPMLAGTLQQGDLDRDGDIDQDDIDAFVSGWLTSKTLQGAHNVVTVGDWETWTWGDMDHDGVVFLSDLAIMHQALVNAGLGGFNAALLSGDTSVPEPSTLVLSALLGVGVCCFRRFATRS